jgi:hypothetical protein
MTLGFPQDVTLYKLLTDWGSLVAGVIALVAAGIAYFAGVCQARATREAANLQISAIERQRNEEIANVRDAVRIEIAALVKYIIGAVGLCEQIAKGRTKISCQDAPYIAKSFWSDPVIYSAIADKVGLLSHAHATTEFYMRVSEAKNMLEILGNKSGLEFMTAKFAATVAESLITALQLARPIVANDGDPSTKSQLEALEQAEMVRQIDKRSGLDTNEARALVKDTSHG